MIINSLDKSQLHFANYYQYQLVEFQKDGPRPKRWKIVFFYLYGISLLKLRQIKLIQRTAAKKHKHKEQPYFIL